MSYKLRQSQTLGENLRRISQKQIEDAIAIAKGEKQTRDTPVHETRKHLKKARAALQLIRKEIGRGLFRQQDHYLRDVGRLTSDIRDAEVRLQTVQQLRGIVKNRGRAHYGNLETMLMLELENFVAAFAEWHTQALPLLERVRDAVDQWAVDHFDCEQLRRAVQSTYKQARRALDKAIENPTAKSFHKFRAKAKTLYHQVRILSPVNPVVLQTLTSDLRSLADLLGRAHDLSFLGDRLRTESGKSQWQREGHELLAVLEVSQSDLQRGASELAQHFFAERPRDFGSRVATWLEEWRHESSPSIAAALAP